MEPFSKQLLKKFSVYTKTKAIRLFDTTGDNIDLSTMKIKVEGN